MRGPGPVHPPPVRGLRMDLRLMRRDQARGGRLPAGLRERSIEIGSRDGGQPRNRLITRDLFWQMRTLG